MKNIAILFSAVAFLFSCSSESVKSSENYIKSFTIEGINPNPEISINDGESSIYVYIYPENYETLFTVEPVVDISENAELSNNCKKWTDEGFLYTVTAENGDTRNYSVVIDMSVPKKYSFESWSLSSGNYIYSMPSDLNSRWSSGNAGIGMALAILGIDVLNPDSYPTQMTENGKEGKAVLMKTIEGGSVFGRSVPLFSGNFFLGDFNANEAIRDELAATKLGRVYPAKPKVIKGWYKYTEGDVDYTENGTVIPNRNDSCNMSVRFYQSDSPSSGKDTTLTVKDIDTSELLLAEATLEDCSDTGGNFKLFELPLEYKEGKIYSDDHHYKLAITFAASRNGDIYAGKIGSTFIVDEIEIEDF